LAGADLRRWLLRVTANRCRLEHRRRGRWFQALKGLAAGRRANARHAAAADERAQREELTAQVEAALGQLSTVEREAVVLRYFCDFDSSEIGELLSLPAATVRSHLLKGRRRLARSLAPWNEQERT
jgi:RNA polymerase sigma-70 factor (ECF subfamily)